jgi:hypothetical protein
MKYCYLKSDIKINKIFNNLGQLDYCLYISDYKDKICKVVLIDASNGMPYKYCITWKDNIVYFTDEKEIKYKNIDQPKIININCEFIQIYLKSEMFTLRFIDNLTYNIGQKILIVDSNSTFFLKYGIIKEAIFDIEYLEKNDFIPKYKIELDNEEICYFYSYQISISI